MTMNVPQDAINSLAEQIFSKAHVYMNARMARSRRSLCATVSHRHEQA